MIRIKLAPLGDVPEEILQELQQDLKKRNFIVYIERGFETPEEAFSPYRHQYDAELILDILRRTQGLVIGLIQEDIFSGKKSFEFDISEYDGGSVISIYRLRPEFYKERPNFDLLINRLLKESIRSVGIIKGLKNCGNPECVMFEAKSVEDIDKKSSDFCKNCRVKIATEGIDL